MINPRTIRCIDKQRYVKQDGAGPFSRLGERRGRRQGDESENFPIHAIPLTASTSAVLSPIHSSLLSASVRTGYKAEPEPQETLHSPITLPRTYLPCVLCYITHTRTMSLDTLSIPGYTIHRDEPNASSAFVDYSTYTPHPLGKSSQ